MPKKNFKSILLNPKFCLTLPSMKRERLLVCVVAFLSLLASCSSGKGEGSDRGKSEEKAKNDANTLTIATVPTMDCLPVFVAFDDSLFQKEGITVDLRQMTAQMDCDTMLAGGWADAIVTDVVRGERLRKHGCGLRYAVGTIASWQLLAGKSARATTLAQLSDKMVAMTRFSATELLTDKALSNARPKPKEAVFRVQVNDVSIRMKMLINNQIDAVWLPEPWATTARLANAKVLSDSKDMGKAILGLQDDKLGVIAFSEKALSKGGKQEQMRRFVKAYNAACDSINKNGVAHYSAVIKKYMFADDKTIDNLPKIRF